MAVDAFARLTSTKSADLASIAPGKGANLIALPFGGSVGDLGGSFRDAVFATAANGVEAAHAQAIASGKSRIIVSGISWVANGAVTTFTLPLEFVGGATCSANGLPLNFTRGFRADDYAAVFTPGDAGLLKFPSWQRLTPQHFGAKADYVSASSPGTDDGPALQAWASELCTRVMPAGRYGTCQTIHWNGDANVNQNAGMQCDPQAWIYQRTDNIPIMTVWGSRGVWNFPILEYASRQASTNYGAVGLLVTPYPGQTGWYSNVIGRIMVRGGANVGFGNPPAISAPLATALAGNESFISTAWAQTDALGNYAWVPGMWVQVMLNNASRHIARITSVSSASYTTTLSGTASGGATSVTVTSASGLAIGQGIAIVQDNGSTFLTTIASIAGTTIGIASALASQASAGASAVASQTALGLSSPIPSAASVGNSVQVTGGTAPSAFPSAFFSNTVQFMFVDEPVRYGIVDRGTGTGDSIANLYVRSAGSGDVTAPTYTIQTAVYISGKGAGSIAQMNVEYLGFISDAIFISSRHFKIGELHIEGCRSYTNSTGLVSGSISDMDIDLAQIEYWTVFTADIANAVGVFYPRAASGTAMGAGRGQWRVKQLNTRKNVLNSAGSAGRAFIAAYPSGNTTHIKIDNWTYNRDGGIYPSGPLTSPSNVGGLVSIGNLLPPDCVAFAFDVDASSDSAAIYQRLVTSPKGQFKIREILALHPSASMTSATAGIYADSTGTTLISSVNNQALSALTDPGKVLAIPLAAGEATTLRAGASDIFYKTNTSQAKPAAITGTTSYLTGRNAGDSNTNLGVINFAAPHGLNVGDIVLISGSVSTAFNGSKRKIVDVPSSTQIVVYVDSPAAVGSSASPVADPAIAVQRMPTLHVMAVGADVGNFNVY